MLNAGKLNTQSKSIQYFVLLNNTKHLIVYTINVKYKLHKKHHFKDEDIKINNWPFHINTVQYNFKVMKGCAVTLNTPAH